MAIVAVASLLALTATTARTAAPVSPGHMALTASVRATLVLSWKNTSPLGFNASPCYNAGANSIMCNATYWVNKDPNGTCAPNGTAQWISNVAVSVSAKFYFEGASPILPTALTYCGGGITAKTTHFWFHVIPSSGTVHGTAKVIAR